VTEVTLSRVWHTIFENKGQDRIMLTLACYIHVTENRNRFLFNNQSDAIIIQIYSVIKICVFRASPLPIIRSSVLYIGTDKFHAGFL